MGRPEELEQMGREWADLKEAARQLDRALKGFAAPNDVEPTGLYRTLVHGDCKSENILFSEDGGRCAMYDFQYVGGGYGARDLAYLFTSSISRRVLQVGCSTHSPALFLFLFLQVLGLPASP